MSQKLTMTNFREFFQRKIPNIVWPAFYMMKSAGHLTVSIAEPEVYGNPDTTYEACFRISYDTVDGLPQEATLKTFDMRGDQTVDIKTLEDLIDNFNMFYEQIQSRLVSVSVHLEMNTFCMHGVEKEINNV